MAKKKRPVPREVYVDYNDEGIYVKELLIMESNEKGLMLSLDEDSKKRFYLGETFRCNSWDNFLELDKVKVIDKDKAQILLGEFLGEPTVIKG